MIRVHRRHQYLRKVFAAMALILKGADAGRPSLVVVCDKISPEVSEEIEEAITHYADDIDFELVEVKRPCADWIGPLNTGLRALQDMGVTHAVQFDDDLVPSPAAWRELVGLLKKWPENLMRVDALWFHVFDEKAKLHNAAFPLHVAPVAYRIFPDDVHSGDIVNHAPDTVARSQAATRLRHGLFHFGYATPDLRAMAWASSKAQGKIDAHTLAIIRPPTLVAYDHSPVEADYYG
jgi:hypothetical protein